MIQYNEVNMLSKAGRSQLKSLPYKTTK